MAQLCSLCKKIPFLTLTCPTASDIQIAHKMKKNGLRFNPFLPFEGSVLPAGQWSATRQQETDSIELGSLGRIRARAFDDGCKLCALFYETIKRRGGVYANKRPIPEDDDNVIIIAVVSYYACVMEEMGASSLRNDELVFLRRLGAYVTVSADTEIDGVKRIAQESLGSYTNIAQSCHVDDFDSDIMKEPRLLFSARKRPDIVDIDLVKRWLDICHTQHELSCSVENEYGGDQGPSSHIQLVRFIDVDRNCISVLRDVDLATTPYLTLSYCWGRDQNVKLDAENSQFFQQEQSLPSDLPQTIQDAICLARRLSFKHLWVDVLCIFQGNTTTDEKDRAAQLEKMGAIYRESNVTIVAACGPTADAGLLGLWPGSRTFEQEIIQVVPHDEHPVHGGLALVSACNSSPPWTVVHQNAYHGGGDLESSTWNSRAWTFQEWTLSRRCLIFTPEQVLWSCDGGVFCEESHFEPPNLYEPGFTDLPPYIQYFHPDMALADKTIDGPLGRWTTNRNNLWTKLKKAITAYTRRNMSCQGDIYDAFKGVLEAFTTISGESFHWGHPRSRFEMSLMWNSPSFAYRLHRRTAETTLPMTALNKHVQLPSWSWMGWVGPVNMTVDNPRIETETPEIACYEHFLSPFRITRIQGTNKFENDHDDDIYRDLKKHVAPKPQPPWKPSTPLKPITPEIIRAHLPGISQYYLEKQPPGHILFFWTSSVFLTVQKPHDYSLSADIVGSLGGAEVKGIVLSNLVNGKSEYVGTVDTMSLEYWKQEPNPAGLQEFIAVGRRVVEDIPGVDTMVLAMQIRWTTKDVNGSSKQITVAERVNFGEIEERAWMEASPAWKLVALR